MTLHAQPLIPGVGPFVGDVAASVFWDITHDDLAVGPVIHRAVGAHVLRQREDSLGAQLGHRRAKTTASRRYR
jgi:hypothetical protein